MVKSADCASCPLYKQCSTGKDAVSIELNTTWNNAIATATSQRETKEQFSKAHEDTLAWIADTEQTVNPETLPKHLQNIGEVYDEAITNLEERVARQAPLASKFNAALRWLLFRRDVYQMFLSERGDYCRGPSDKRVFPWLKATRTCNSAAEPHIKSTVSDMIATDARFTQALSEGALPQAAYDALLHGQFGP